MSWSGILPAVWSCSVHLNWLLWINETKRVRIASRKCLQATKHVPIGGKRQPITTLWLKTFFPGPWARNRRTKVAAAAVFRNNCKQECHCASSLCNYHVHYIWNKQRCSFSSLFIWHLFFDKSLLTTRQDWIQLEMRWVNTTLTHKQTIIDTPGEKENLKYFVKLTEIICFNSFFIFTVTEGGDILTNICRQFQEVCWFLPENLDSCI